MNDQNELPVEALPLFARLLEGAETHAATGGTTPTYHCLDSECTKKYPSDQDDGTKYMNPNELY